jgi:hypothetical protein
VQCDFSTCCVPDAPEKSWFHPWRGDCGRIEDILLDLSGVMRSSVIPYKRELGLQSSKRNRVDFDAWAQRSAASRQYSIR